MIDAPLALAFASGMVATVNPCGFAMLPAYLSYFLGLEASPDGPQRAGPLRAVSVGGMVSAGFMVVFGLAGILFSWFSVSLTQYAPWVTIVIGLLLVVLGIALLAGWEPTISLPKLEKGTKGRGLGSMFVFGVSYAIASLGCTLPVFLANVVNTFERSNLVSGIAVFFTYSLGMALVLMVVTLALALAREGLVTRMKQGLRYVQRLAGGLLVLTGAYVAYYAWTEIKTNNGDLRPNGLADRTTALASDLQAWVQNVGAIRLGLVLGLVLAIATLVTLLRLRPVDAR